VASSVRHTHAVATAYPSSADPIGEKRVDRLSARA
jgi:hypothetical protein